MATLVERVRALQGGLPLDAEALAARKADIASGAAVTADNLADRLTQAVQEGDDAALDACLTAPVGHAAIRTAAAALAPAAAEAALAAAYARFRRRPGRGAQPAVWMRSLLASHAGHLHSSRDAAPLLGALQGGVMAAAGAQGRLLSLAGRLQLALAQQPGGGGGAARPPALQFADDDAPQPEPEAADAMMDPTPAAAAAEESSDDEDGASDGAWASDGEDGSGSEEEAISD